MQNDSVNDGCMTIMTTKVRRRQETQGFGHLAIGLTSVRIEVSAYGIHKLTCIDHQDN